MTNWGVPLLSVWCAVIVMCCGPFRITELGVGCKLARGPYLGADPVGILGQEKADVGGAHDA